MKGGIVFELFLIPDPALVIPFPAFRAVLPTPRLEVMTSVFGLPIVGHPIRTRTRLYPSARCQPKALVGARDGELPDHFRLVRRKRLGCRF